MAMFRFVLLLICLAGCAPHDRNQWHDGATKHIVSRDTEAFRDGKDHINARTIILVRGRYRRYYLSLTVLRGGPNGPRLRAMHQNGQELAYQVHDRLRRFCIDHCHKSEIGAINLSALAFETATRDGMKNSIDGKRRDYQIVVPARLFRSVLAARPP